MGKFVVASREYLDTMIGKRAGETKLGECVQTIEDEDWEAALTASTAKFVLLGIPEDVGIRANYGVGGAHTAWEPTLRAFLNIQETEHLKGECILVMGAFDFDKVMERADRMDIEQLRGLTGYIDETVTPLITKIVAAGKVPVVVGGGHNNCYPLLKGASLVNDKPLNCINLDAHSDFREMEGRHSGNGFRYAHREGYLHKYVVLGLHENYNARNIIEELKDDPDLHHVYYEDIFIREKISFEEAIQNAISRTSARGTGIELDLDCIEGALSSAMTPAGLTPLQARRFVTICAHEAQPVYLHIAEGATALRDGRTGSTTPKLIAYLISDFIKAYRKRSSWFGL